MTWNAIATADEASSFLALVEDLHDGCLREVHLWTEHAVAEDLAMTVGSGWDARVRLLLQRQGRPLSAVERIGFAVRREGAQPTSRLILPNNHPTKDFVAKCMAAEDSRMPRRWA